MDHMLYTAMSGARQALDQQAVVTHNLANVTTPGFRAQLHAARAVEVRGDGLLTRAMTQSTTPIADFSPGAISTSGRELDVAIMGKGWLAVQAQDGSEAYTRRGDIQVNNEGMLLIAGRPVIGDGGPINVPQGSQVAIGSDGTISVRGQGDAATNVAAVGRLKLVAAPEPGLLRGGDGLFRTRNNQPLQADETIRLASGALEGSNVSPTEAMVSLIDNARRYEMHMQSISTAKDDAQRANSILSLS
ncbi:MAG: flagellar basal body rod protein FlgF [Pseudomonas sp.]